MPELALPQLIWNGRVFLQLLAGDTVTSKDGGEMSHLVADPSTSNRYVCADGKAPGVHW